MKKTTKYLLTALWCTLPAGFLIFIFFPDGGIWSELLMSVVLLIGGWIWYWLAKSGEKR